MNVHRLIPCCLLVAVCWPAPRPSFGAPPPGRPNVIFILADDLGYGELGCYGQERIRTPNIDRLATEGMRFTQHYSGSPVCAPSRCTLLTGLHTGHAFIRANSEIGGWGPDDPEGQFPLPAGTTTVATLLRDHGYATAAIGKWGLGGPVSSGHPNRQGFDLFYGYLCQRVAHNYYPTHLWRDDRKEMLEGNRWFSAHQRLEEPPADGGEFQRFEGVDYAPDRMIAEALRFVREHRDDPFLLYFATPVPHAAIQVPRDSLEAYLENGWDDGPYLGQKGYLPHPAARAGYAAMISRLDRDVGRLLDLLDELGLGDDTIVLFSSDNGPTYNGGTDSTFFRSAGPLRGLKGSLYEGGIRVPLIVRWPRLVPAGRVTGHPSAFWDILPTLCELTGADVPDGIDGLSFAGVLSGGPQDARRHDHLYWEHRGRQAVRAGRFKALKHADGRIELYDLEQDVGETRNVASEHPEILAEMQRIMLEERTESEAFPLVVGP